MSGVARSAIAMATDGCGVVSFGLPLRGLALAFARLADPSGVSDPALRAALERIRDAMMAHPELVAGERRRLDTALMRAVPGRLVSKAGAEGVAAIAMLAGAGGRKGKASGLAIKIEDGDASNRARNVVSCHALRELGVLADADLERLAEYASPPILDPRGNQAGEVRAAFELQKH
jgi:L-asparaginase II